MEKLHLLVESTMPTFLYFLEKNRLFFVLLQCESFSYKEKYIKGEKFPQILPLQEVK